MWTTALQDGPTWHERPAWARRKDLIEGFGVDVVLGAITDHLAVELKERAEESIAQPHGASYDGIEDRLDVGRGAADDPQDLGRGRLLRQAFRQALLELARASRSLGFDLRLCGLGASPHSS